MLIDTTKGEPALFRLMHRVYSLASLQAARDFWRAGDLDGAFEEMQLAVTLNPQNPETFVIRGLILADQGKISAARSDIRFGLELGGPDWAYANLVRASLEKLAA